MRVIGYVRLSPGERKSAHGGSNQDALGPEAQRAAIERWAKDNGAGIVWATPDIDVSGSKGHDQRPGLAEAIMRLRRGEGEAIVVARRDRFMRASAMTTAFAEAEIAAAGGRVISADGIGNGDTPEDVLIRRIVDAMAEYKRLRTSEDTKAALAIKKAKGEYVGGVPYGYKRQGDSLIAVDAEVEVVQIASQLREDGRSLREIAAELNIRAIPTQRGGRWEAVTVKRILDRAA